MLWNSTIEIVKNTITDEAKKKHTVRLFSYHAMEEFIFTAQ
jgi:hypothetical protein